MEKPPCFHLAPAQCLDPMLTLTGREAHHALHVLRLRRGERVMVLDGEGHEIHCEARALARDTALLTVLERKFVPPLPYRITLLQAIPKGRIFESIVQKTTELGVYRLVPLLSERVTTRPEEGNASHKAEKWHQTAVEAIKQCGSPWLPIIESPMTPGEFLSRGEKFDLALIASLGEDSRHPRERFKDFFAIRKRMPQTLCVWVGPEGDFTPAEIGMIQSAGAQPVTLGGLVLRSETAAIYCASVLSYELQFGAS